MTPTRILPNLQFSVVCEDIRREMAAGMVTMVGVLQVIPVPHVPVNIFKMFLVNRWNAGVGQFNETVRLVAPDGSVLRKSDIRFALQDPNQSATNVTFLGQLQLPAVGIYQVEILVDEVMKMRFPLPVGLMQPTPGEEAPQPPAQPA